MFLYNNVIDKFTIASFVLIYQLLLLFLYCGIQMKAMISSNFKLLY